MPEAFLTIAQRFNAGTETKKPQVPQRRPNRTSKLQPPLRGLAVVRFNPALKRRAIIILSRRDKAAGQLFAPLNRWISVL